MDFVHAHLEASCKIISALEIQTTSLVPVVLVVVDLINAAVDLIAKAAPVDVRMVSFRNLVIALARSDY